MNVGELRRKLKRYGDDTEIVILKPAHNYLRQYDVVWGFEIEKVPIVGEPPRVSGDWLDNGGHDESSLDTDEVLRDVIVIC